MDKLNCYSINDFNILMKTSKFHKNGGNVPKDIAIISICEPKENRWDSYPKRHFIKNTDNILLIDFDDVDPDDKFWEYSYRTVPDNNIIYSGTILYPISDKQAEEIVKFIVKNIGKSFFIHCYAGISRSKAVVKFIIDNFKEYSDYNYMLENSYPNQYVLKKLNEAYNTMYRNTIE